MSEENSAGTEKTGTPKKSVSPVRNVVGIVVLVVVLVVGWFEYSAKSGFNGAVTAVDHA